MPKRLNDLQPGQCLRSTIIAFTIYALRARRAIHWKAVANHLGISRPQAYRYRSAFCAEFPELAADVMPKGRCIRPADDQTNVNIYLRRTMRFSRWALTLGAPATLDDIAIAAGIARTSAYKFRESFHAAAPDLGPQLLPYTRPDMVASSVVVISTKHRRLPRPSTKSRCAKLRSENSSLHSRPPTWLGDDADSSAWGAS